MVFGDKLFAQQNSRVEGVDFLKISKIFDLKNIKYLKITNELKVEHCCFLHFLMGKKRNLCKRNDLEKEIEKSKTIADEISLYRNFLKKYFNDFFTEETENFLCFSTRFEEDERITIEQAFNHMFLANFDDAAYLRNNCEGMTKHLKLFIKNDNLEISKMYLNSILKNLCSYFASGERWFDLEDENSEEPVWNKILIEKNSPLIHFLSYEFGVSFEHLWTRLQQIKCEKYKYTENDVPRKAD